MRTSSRDPHRSSYLVAYDVSSPRRLYRVHKLLESRGTPLQYSVFVCRLTRTERDRLTDEIAGLMDLDEDRLMFVPFVPQQMLLMGRDTEPRTRGTIEVA